jgi:hypothetical protein
LVTHYDRQFELTKALKQGTTALGEPLATLAAWIGATWQVTVLNIVQDRIERGRPRLQVVVEHDDERSVFMDGMNFDAAKQRAIAERFGELSAGGAQTQVDGQSLFVAFSAFAPLARDEAHASISEVELQQLQHRLDDPALWLIHRCFSLVTFMFHTIEQARLREAEGAKTLYAAQYYELLRRRDEFGYCDLSTLSVAIDSKERFDSVYAGSWFNYDR